MTRAKSPEFNIRKKFWNNRYSNNTENNNMENNDNINKF